MNKSTLLTLLMIILGPASLISVKAQDLTYTAVDPCRIVDTREAGGVITANNFRNFLVSGTIGELAVQGGKTDCLDPKAGTGQEPSAISAYVITVPATSAGSILTAYPSDQPPPPVGAGSTVNSATGQVIGNTTNITLCDPAGSCPTDGEFAILARNTDQHVIVDVQGYFYPLSGGDGQVAAGQYEGTGQGIYMDGTTSEITAVAADISQEGNFIYGTAQFTVKVGVNDPATQGGQLSGHIQGNAIKGLFGGCTGPAPECVGAAIFDGELTGDELLGTVVDLSDGSTFTLTLQRTSP